jgi:cytochrome oxidase assembly protein ShyY1
MKVKHFSLYGRRYYLKLELVQSITFVSIFLLCSLLAIWQWQRAETSHGRELQAEALKTTAHNQIVLTGQWQNENFLLDNRTHKGKVGYYHLALFKAAGSAHHLLINLGWLQAPILRSDIPNTLLPTGQQTITLKNLPIIKPVVWTSDHWPSPNNKAWPKRIQSIDIERFELATKFKIDPSYWQLIAGEGKLVDIYQSSPYLNKHKHLGYAMQWLLIAIAALMVGIFSAIRLEEKVELSDKVRNKELNK